MNQCWPDYWRIYAALGEMPCYWLRKLRKFLSCTMKNFIYLRHLMQSWKIIKLVRQGLIKSRLQYTQADLDPTCSAVGGWCCGNVHCHITSRIEAETRWSPFCGRHIQRRFLEWKLLFFIQISLKPKGPIHNEPALVLIMAFPRTGDKLISEPMMA